MRDASISRFGPATRQVLAGRPKRGERNFVNPPVVRGSTVLHPDCEDRLTSFKGILDQVLIYGIEGTPTHWALEDWIAEVEGGTRCQIFSSGLNALTAGLLAYVEAGAHLLMPDGVYGPTRGFCEGMLKRLGVVTEYYVPTADPADVEAMFRDETRVLFVESPSSHTFEVQDVPALAAVARARGVCVMMDNTWGIGTFQPFAHGVDVSMQALTKYVSGHADVMLGSLTVNDEAHWARVRMAAMDLGCYASSDDCWLALRGARTMQVRLDHQMQAGLEVARWFASRPEVLEVRHPALPGAMGHELWLRDFTGAPSLFGVVFRPPIVQADVNALLDRLELFGIGASWGGFESLALPSTGLRRAHGLGFGGPAARFHVGLEEVADLVADLEQGFGVFG